MRFFLFCMTFLTIVLFGKISGAAAFSQTQALDLLGSYIEHQARPAIQAAIGLPESDPVELDIMIDWPDGSQMLSSHQSGEIELFKIDPTGRYFAASLALPNRRAPVERVTVTGQLTPMRRTAVPRQRIARGTRLRQEDFTEIRVPVDSKISYRNVKHGLSWEELDGMEAARSLSPMRPVKADWVRPPQLVKRGSQVLIELIAPSMRLSLMGVALENGGEGETIRVRNPQSRVEIEGIVVGENRLQLIQLGSGA